MDSGGPKEPCITGPGCPMGRGNFEQGAAHCKVLGIPSICNGDAAFCQITCFRLLTLVGLNLCVRVYDGYSLSPFSPMSEKLDACSCLFISCALCTDYSITYLYSTVCEVYRFVIIFLKFDLFLNLHHLGHVFMFSVTYCA